MIVEHRCQQSRPQESVKRSGRRIDRRRIEDSCHQRVGNLDNGAIVVSSKQIEHCHEVPIDTIVRTESVCDVLLSPIQLLDNGSQTLVQCARRLVVVPPRIECERGKDRKDDRHTFKNTISECRPISQSTLQACGNR